MKVFATRVWGFAPERWPVITFGLEGNRDNLLRESAVGDLIVFVGTRGYPTHESERGRLLGMAEIGRMPVDTLDVIAEDARSEHDYDEHGRFRWPKAILMVRAWRFEPQPLLTEVLARQLSYAATPQAVVLTDADATAVRALRAVPVELPVSAALSRAQLLDAALGASRPTTGPTPSSWSGQVDRDTSRAAFTYALQFGTTDIWKIGHAIDVAERVRQVNWHIPSEVVRESWRPVLQHSWPEGVAAHEMEQRVLAALDRYRTVGERVRCPEAEIRAAWLHALGVSP